MKDILLFLAVLAALFSKELDRRFTGNGKLRFVILVFCAGVVAVELLPVLFNLL